MWKKLDDVKLEKVPISWKSDHFVKYFCISYSVKKPYPLHEMDNFSLKILISLSAYGLRHDVLWSMTFWLLQVFNEMWIHIGSSKVDEFFSMKDLLFFNINRHYAGLIEFQNTNVLCKKYSFGLFFILLEKCMDWSKTNFNFNSEAKSDLQD